MSGLVVKVDTNGLQEKLRFFTDVEAKNALRLATRRVGNHGRDLVRSAAPKKTGVGAAGIKSTMRSSGSTAVARIYPSGPHAHIMRWQDQGVVSRHTKKGANRGALPALHYFELAAATLEITAGLTFDAAIQEALLKSGL